MNFYDIIRAMIKEDIHAWIRQTLHTEVDFVVEYPTDISYGDYATNVALVLGKSRQQNPRELAEEFAVRLNTHKLTIIDKVEVAGPGFINIFLTKKFFGNIVSTILTDGDAYGKNKTVQQKISYEYTNTNVLKPMHIGHLMGNVIGEALSRIAEWNGADVVRNTYQGDVGLHIAKTIWGIQHMEGKRVSGSLSEDVAYIGDAYVKGAEAYEADERAQIEIKDINKKVYDGTDPDVNTLKDWAKQISLNHFRELYRMLGTTFNDELFESDVAQDAVSLVHTYLGKGVFEESDGAIVFNGKKYDETLHTRVFITSAGVPTYEAKDIAHAIRKYDTYHFDTSIIVTANEQDEYFKVVLTALMQIRPDIAEKTQHLSHGMLRLATGKMSSRKGNVITGEALLRQSFDGVMEKHGARDADMSEQDIHAIGVAALKYVILKQAPGKDIVFDFEKSLSFEGDSGPYVQYTAVRTKALCAKAQHEGVAHQVNRPDYVDLYDIERMMHRFPEVVSRAYIESAPQAITTYLIELASAFNTFYGLGKIIDKDDEVSPYKIALTKAVGQVLTNGLYVLGMTVPTKM